MAHTKQTPKKPNIDRPTAAMGSDVQPERRAPLKPTSKKIATKRKTTLKTFITQAYKAEEISYWWNQKNLIDTDLDY